MNNQGRWNRLPLVERFWLQVAKRSSGCWEWTSCLKRGYGTISVKGQSTPAHRFSYELAYSQIPAGKLVLHNCDNPKCVRPSHLRIGTQLKNIEDRQVRGRQAKGDQINTVKLTSRDVLNIRKLKNRGWKNSKLATRFDVSDRNIHAIVNNQTWKHI